MMAPVGRFRCPLVVRGYLLCTEWKDLMTDVEDAKDRLEWAERELRGCDAHLAQALSKWLDAQAAGGSNERHYRLRRIHGDDYREKLMKDKDSALRGLHDAQEQVKKAKADYDEATKD